jgi:hypothetical protein
MTRAAASEQQVHQTIAVFLNRALPEGSWHCAIDSAGKASIRVAQNLKARGGQRGTPDHLVLVPGLKALFFEVKTAIGRVSPEQEHVGARIFNAGHYWVVVRSVEDAEATLRDLGVPLRATVYGIRASIAAQNDGLKPIRKRAAGGKRVARPTQAQVRRAEAARRVGLV